MAAKGEGGAAASPEMRKEKVDGVSFEVYPARLKTWRAVKIARRFSGDEIDIDKLLAMVELVEFATSLDEAAIEAHCGGEDASFDDVLAFASKVVQKVFPKN